ncbi:unnamed protein product [Rotaria sp. Silwood2]|nr:unnamed protein product [Rotaria sp. Silwood2]
MYTVSIDGLPLHIIELDQTPVVPYTVSSFMINAAQRVSFYVNLNEFDQNFVPPDVPPTKSIYIRFKADMDMYPVDISSCIAPYATPYLPYPVFLNPLYLAILSLDSSNSLPTYPVNQATSRLSNRDFVNRQDVNILGVRPFSQTNNLVPCATHFLNIVITFRRDSNNITRGFLNNVTYGSDENNLSNKSISVQSITSDKIPLLHQMITTPNALGNPSPIITNESPLPVIQSDGNGHYLVPYQAVVDIRLENKDEDEHPFHLHGHSFWIISTSENPQAKQRYRGAYIQPDVVSVPGSGWAKIRFLANNSGAWVFHCRIEWHMYAGLIFAFIVGPDELLAHGYTSSDNQKLLCQ